jgi:acyl-CoA reductase-like NAD-dependent aldehyde dehydrogenase
LPGNTFTCLVAVGEAVLRGGHIVVRPSRHEPFAAARFVAALLAAGWPADRMSFLPTAPAALGPLVTGTDRQIVYGGPDLVSALPPGSTARLDLRGPGRGFAVVGADADPDTTVDRLMDLIAGDSGRFCRNVRTIACLGDPEPLALRLSGALDAVRIDRTDPRWPIAATPAPVAAAYRELIDSRIGAGDRRRTSRPVVVECAGRTFLAPTLVQVAAAGGHPLVGFEVPFPFATITAVDPAAASVLAARSLFTYDLTS